MAAHTYKDSILIKGVALQIKKGFIKGLKINILIYWSCKLKAIPNSIVDLGVFGIDQSTVFQS